jgi:hypothetical protein
MKSWFRNEMFGKGTLVATVAWLLLAATSPAQASSCSNASLNGKYGQTISGELLPGPGVVLPQNGVAMTTFDGKGNSPKRQRTVQF